MKLFRNKLDKIYTYRCRIKNTRIDFRNNLYRDLRKKIGMEPIWESRTIPENQSTDTLIIYSHNLSTIMWIWLVWG